MITPGPAEIEGCRTPKGGFTRAQLAKWGVPWPPPSGWKKRLIAQWETENPEAVSRRREKMRVRYPVEATINGTKVTVWDDWIEWPSEDERYELVPSGDRVGARKDPSLADRGTRVPYSSVRG